jgi:hypothetical protein
VPSSSDIGQRDLVAFHVRLSLVGVAEGGPISAFLMHLNGRASAIRYDRGLDREAEWALSSFPFRIRENWLERP